MLSTFRRAIRNFYSVCRWLSLITSIDACYVIRQIHSMQIEFFFSNDLNNNNNAHVNFISRLLLIRLMNMQQPKLKHERITWAFGNMVTSPKMMPKNLDASKWVDPFSKSVSETPACIIITILILTKSITRANHITGEMNIQNRQSKN